jgi:hypothetical protein
MKISSIDFGEIIRLGFKDMFSCEQERITHLFNSFITFLCHVTNLFASLMNGCTIAWSENNPLFDHLSADRDTVGTIKTSDFYYVQSATKYAR